MTKDVIIIVSILVFWFFLGITMSAINADASLAKLTIQGNDTFVSSDVNQADLNLSFDSDVEDSPTTKTIWDMIKSVFTFSMSDNAAFPSIISTFIGFINFLLLFVLGTIVFRIIVHGGN